MAPGFFGSAIKTDLDTSVGILLLSYIVFKKSVTLSIQNSSKHSIGLNGNSV